MATAGGTPVKRASRRADLTIAGGRFAYLVYTRDRSEQVPGRLEHKVPGDFVGDRELVYVTGRAQAFVGVTPVRGDDLTLIDTYVGREPPRVPQEQRGLRRMRRKTVRGVRVWHRATVVAGCTQVALDVGRDYRSSELTLVRCIVRVMAEAETQSMAEDVVGNLVKIVEATLGR